MWTLLLVVLVSTGFPALFHTAPVQGRSDRCSFAGVFHVKGTGNYSLTFHQALELCQSLGYRLAGQEQVTEAYNKGLRTCRYGWTEGQNVMFLPSPNCELSSSEVTLHSEAKEHFSDVYCFNPSDSFNLNCEDAVKSDSASKNTPTAIKKTNEDILVEALIEGFLVDLKKTTDNIQTETSSLTGKVIPIPAGSKQKVTSLEREAAKRDPNLFAVPALEEPTADTEDARSPTDRSGFDRSFSAIPNVLFPEAEGSGSGSGMLSQNPPNPSEFTTRLITTQAAGNIPIQDDYVDLMEFDEKVQGENLSSEGRMNLHMTPQSQKRLGTPARLVIFASCVVVGAILCVFGAIAIKDKWFGPRQSKTNMSEIYGKVATLPLSKKEQEIVTLMSAANLKNDKPEDVSPNVTCLDKHEGEYLM